VSETSIVCTLFDKGFLQRGVALINSLNEHEDVDLDFKILCLDDISANAVRELQMKNIEVLLLEDILEPKLIKAQQNRSWREFCWTLPACLLKYLIVERSIQGKLFYVDSDCFFFSSPRQMFALLDEGNEIVVHEHRFSPDRVSWQATSGRFNVGVVGGLIPGQFEECVERWSAQVLDECVLDPENGKCGDQTYLDEWPELYSKLHIMEDKGIGVAPWNMNSYQLRAKNNVVFVDRTVLVFFHFSRFQIFFERLGFIVYTCAGGYDVTPAYRKLVYRRYAKALLKASKDIRSSKTRWVTSLNKDLVRVIRRSEIQVATSLSPTSFFSRSPH
jgi:hypothetical protein